MDQYARNLKAGTILAKATDQIGDVIQRNFVDGTTMNKAIAVLSALQYDLFSSFVILQPNRGPVVARSIILRTILENHGTMIHVQKNEKRASRYLENIVSFDHDLAAASKMEKVAVLKSEWTTSTIADRVSKIDKNSSFIYDLLSNFTHGNNITNLLSPERDIVGYEPMIEDYFVSEYIQFLFIMVHELKMDEKFKKIIYVAMKDASRIALDGRVDSSTQ